MRLRTDNTGVVLLTVLMVVLVLSIFAAAILSQNLSQSSSAQVQVDEIKARELAQGAYWKTYADLRAGTAPSVPNEVMDGKTFSINVNNSSTQYNAAVSYP